MLPRTPMSWWSTSSSGAGRSRWVEWNSSRSVGSRVSFLGTQDRSSGPYLSQSTRYSSWPPRHRSPRFRWTCRWCRPPESKEEGVPMSGQALWREKQESGKAWVVKHGRKDVFCIEEGVVTGRWLGWFVWWWWRGQRIRDLTSCRAAAYGVPCWQSDLLSRLVFRIFGSLKVCCDLVPVHCPL